MTHMLGIDTGGTYTDAVIVDQNGAVLSKAKSLTTRDRLERGIGEAARRVLARLGATGPEIGLVSLSTTLATNALVEGQGGRVALIMIGFERSALEQADLEKALNGDPVIFLPGGHNAHGDRRMALDPKALDPWLDEVAGEVEAFAIAGHFAVRNREDELAVRAILRARTDKPVTCSHELSARLDGPRRALTSVLNGRLIALIDRLIRASEAILEKQKITAPLMVVRGDGALISARVARERPIETILSGPAASLVGAAHLTGKRSAVASDIGGTTTDIALLKDGVPRIDPDGATVGGWRTMVEAVAMTTIGLGGDSEISVRMDGLEAEIAVGPKRLVPISLFAASHETLVSETLDRQLRDERPGDYAGRFVISLQDDSATVAGLPDAEKKLLEQLQGGAMALDRLIRIRVQLGSLGRLVVRGQVAIAGFTPSDAAHVLGEFGQWNREAARKAARLFARRRTPRGRYLAGDEVELSEQVRDRLVARSAETVLDVAFAEDGFGQPQLSRSPLAAAALAGHAGLVKVGVSLSRPLIGLGASAATYYPRVADMLGCQSIVPADADVANAIGAVVGYVREVVKLMVSQPAEGRFRVHGEPHPREFSTLEEASDFARGEAERQARHAAAACGAGVVEVSTTFRQKAATIDGQDVFIEGYAIATAIGRPRIGIDEKREAMAGP